jgi:MFS family permease
LSVPAVVHRRPNASAFAGVFAATLLCFLAVGAVLPVLPRYVTGPLGGGDLEVGLVTGAFAFTAIVGRPVGGRIADRRGRRLVVLAGLAITALAGALYFLPFGVAGLLVARLVLGLGDGWVFTAGLAWTVDLAPPERRGQTIAIYGLGVWGGLSVGPLAGEALYAVGSYDAVWVFAALVPLAGAAVVRVVPDRRPTTPRPAERQPLLPAAALRPGVALFLANVGYATLAGFVILHLDDLGVGGGAAVFTAFATTVVLARIALSWLPDRVGPRRTAAAAGVLQAIGLALIAVTGGLPLAIAGALVMGTGFSLSFPSLAVLVVERVDEDRRGAAMGGFTAFFDLGVGLGAPLAGAISAVAGYPTAFGVAAGAALAGAILTVTGGAGRPASVSPSPS